MCITITELSKKLQNLLIEDANEIGRTSGFIQRQRKLSGSSFAQSLIFGWQANPQASLEELCQSVRLCGIEITPQGLQERLNSEKASEFFRQLLLKAVTYLVQGESNRDNLLASFNGVYLQDSTKIELPACLHTIWQGNKQTQASLKIQTVLDYQTGLFDLTLASGRAHDCPLQTINLPSGSLRLADLGYFKINVFEQLNERDIWWVSRVPARVGIWQENAVVHLAHWLQKQPPNCVIDRQVELTAQCLPSRLIAFPVPAHVSQKRRQQAREAASKRSKSKLKDETLQLCDWTIIVTNLPVESFSPHDILCLQRLRWQIELLFKLWKSELSVDDWRSQQPYQILTEVYAKLLLALIQHWFLLLGCWALENRSLVKASKALRKHAFHILAVFTNLDQLTLALSTILPTLQRCLIQKRKARPATFQLLGRASP